MKYLEITTVKIRVNTAWLKDASQKIDLIIQRQPSRYILTGLASLKIHLLLLGLCWGLSTLSEPPVMEIREFTFVDLSEDLTEESQGGIESMPTIKTEVPPKKPVEKKPRKNTPGRQPQSKPQPRLDMIRKQAPISLATHSPIPVSKESSSDILKISPAKGTQNTKKVLNLSAPISLNKKVRLVLPEKKRNPAFEARREPAPKIALNTNKIDRTTLATDSKVKPLQPSLQGQVTAASRRRSRMFITGPLSSRGIVEKSIPKFPRWAKRKGIGASISLQFTVMEDGKVKENIAVVRTSGSPEWDDAVAKTLKTWHFEPLARNARLQDQTGIITFQFVID